MFANTTGSSNCAFGDSALADNISGIGNVAIGDSAGTGNTSGDFNIYIGVFTNPAPDGESDTIRIGDPPTATACFVGGIFGQTVGGTGLPVVVDTNGQLGTIVSSKRFKHDIKPMDKTSEGILALKPATFRYNSDVKGTPQFGLIAEEVAQVNPDLVVRDKNGELLSVRYEAVNAMLLNEFLKEHRKVERLEKQVEALTAGLQKVSAQIELSKRAPQTVLNNH
jgi:Chaperone of endosialidase